MSRLLSLSSKVKKTGRKARKRLGRGNSSGHGTYSTKGVKGQTARTGGRRRPGFEGGQTPYLRKLPKLKGFKNPNAEEYQVINVNDLNQFENGSNIEIKDLVAKKLISKANKPVKLLGDGTLEKNVTVNVNKASKSAIAKVEAQKGTVTLI